MIKWAGRPFCTFPLLEKYTRFFCDRFAAFRKTRSNPYFFGVTISTSFALNVKNKAEQNSSLQFVCSWLNRTFMSTAFQSNSCINRPWCMSSRRSSNSRRLPDTLSSSEWTAKLCRAYDSCERSTQKISSTVERNCFTKTVFASSSE